MSPSAESGIHPENFMAKGWDRHEAEIVQLSDEELVARAKKVGVVLSEGTRDKLIKAVQTNEAFPALRTKIEV